MFDVAWSAIDCHYYDRTFHGLDWAAVRADFRPRAALAESDSDLYINVLGAMVEELQDPHVLVAPNAARAWVRPLSGQVVADCPAPGPGIGDDGFRVGRAWSRHVAAVVTDVRKGSAAERAGLDPGAELSSWSTTRSGCGPVSVAVNVLRSPAGPSRLVTFTLARETQEPSHSVQTLAGGIDVLRFNSFDAVDGRWLLFKLEAASARGVILDLRHNHGGALRVLKVLAGALMGSGRPLGTTVDAGGRHSQQSRRINLLDRILIEDYGTPSGFAYRGPLIVLIGPESGSAAEMLAESLRYNGRATLVGERSRGEVELANDFPLPDGGRIQVATADILDPNGRRLENRGVEPDAYARQTLAAIRLSRDLIVEAAEREILFKPKAN